MSRKGTLEDSFDPPDPADTTHPALHIQRKAVSYRSLIAAMRWALSTLRMTLDLEPERIAGSVHFADQIPQPWDMPDYPRAERDERFQIPLPELEHIDAIRARIDMECPYLCAIFNSALYGLPCMEPLRPLGDEPTWLPDLLRYRRRAARQILNEFNTRAPVMQAIDALSIAANRIEELELELKVKTSTSQPPLPASDCSGREFP